MRKSKVPEKKNGADASSTSNFSEITHPSEFDSRSKNKKGEPVLALWQPKKVEKSKYRSDNEESLSSTASIADYENLSLYNDSTFQSRNFDKHRKSLGDGALKRLQGLAAKKYGSISNLFRMVRLRVALKFLINF